MVILCTGVLSVCITLRVLFTVLYYTNTPDVSLTHRMTTDAQRFWEDDSSDEDRPTPAFPVDDDNTFTENDGQLPATAAEYLQIVRRHAATLPKVFVSSKTPYVQVVNNPALSVTKLAHTPPSLRPSPNWAREQILKFSRLQRRTFNIQYTKTSPSTKTEWVDLICGDKVHNDFVKAADFKSIAVAISAFDELLPCIQRDYEEANGMAVRDAILAGCRAQWLYALLTRLHLCVFTQFFDIN